jgi:hypothetical protein
MRKHQFTPREGLAEILALTKGETLLLHQRKYREGGNSKPHSGYLLAKNVEFYSQFENQYGFSTLKFNKGCFDFNENSKSFLTLEPNAFTATDIHGIYTPKGPYVSDPNFNETTFFIHLGRDEIKKYLLERYDDKSLGKIKDFFGDSLDYI